VNWCTTAFTLIDDESKRGECTWVPVHGPTQTWPDDETNSKYQALKRHGPPFTSGIFNYTKKVIYCGTQNNVLLRVYITTIIHIQNQNKVVELLVAWLFTMPHVGSCSYQL
jgi:hypothetical protein